MHIKDGLWDKMEKKNKELSEKDNFYGILVLFVILISFLLFCLMTSMGIIK